MNNLNNNAIVGLLLVLVNFLSKFLFLTRQDIAGDEPYSIFYAQMSVSRIFEELVKGNNPPLYEIILHGWTFVFGISPMSVRFLSCVFASITVYIIYQIGVQFFSKRIGLLAAGFYTLSNFFIYFSHEARVYALFAFLATWSFLLFMELGNGKRDYVRIFLLALVNALMLYAHYFGVVVILIQVLVFIFIQGYRSLFFNSYVGSYLITGLLYFPFLKIFLERLSSVSQDGTWLTPPNGVASIYELVVKMSNAPVIAVFFLLILIVGLIRTMVVKKWNSISKEHWVVFLWFALTVFLVWTVSYVMPLFLDRYLLYTAIAFYFLLAFSIELFKEKKFLRIILTVLCIGGMVFTVKLNPSNNRQVKSMVDHVVQLNSESNNIVYICPDYLSLSFGYYYRRNCFSQSGGYRSEEGLKDAFRADHIYPISSREGIDFKMWKTFDKVIFIDAAANFAYPNNGILPLLEDSLTLINKSHFESLFDVYVFK